MHILKRFDAFEHICTRVKNTRILIPISYVRVKAEQRGRVASARDSRSGRPGFEPGVQAYLCMLGPFFLVFFN